MTTALIRYDIIRFDRSSSRSSKRDYVSTRNAPEHSLLLLLHALLYCLSIMRRALLHDSSTQHLTAIFAAIMHSSFLTPSFFAFFHDVPLSTVRVCNTVCCSVASTNRTRWLLLRWCSTSWDLCSSCRWDCLVYFRIWLDAFSGCWMTFEFSIPWWCATALWLDSSLYFSYEPMLFTHQSISYICCYFEVEI